MTKKELLKSTGDLWYLKQYEALFKETNLIGGKCGK